MNTIALQFENIFTPFRFFDDLITNALGDDANAHVQQAADEIANNDPHGQGDMDKAVGELENNAADKQAEEEAKADDEESTDEPAA